MDIDVGPNAPGSNFSRLERHSADRRIGPASLNHHPNRLCGRQRPHKRIYGSSVSCLLAGLGLAGRMGVICSVGVAHGSSDLAAVLGVSFL